MSKRNRSQRAIHEKRKEFAGFQDLLSPVNQVTPSGIPLEIHVNDFLSKYRINFVDPKRYPNTM